MELETLASLLFAADHRSRRAAKRVMHEVGLPADSAALDAALVEARTGPLREQVAARVEEMIADAERAAQADDVYFVGGDGLPEWLVSCAVDDHRVYIMYMGRDHPFLAEILEEGDEIETVAAMDDGERLGVPIWFIEPAAPERAAELFREARRAHRAWNMRDLD